MKKIPITICLYTTTKGHFGITTRYVQTINSLFSQVPGSNFFELRANIKSDGEQDAEWETQMSNWLTGQGFIVNVRRQPWKHGDQSHQTGYLEDQLFMVQNVRTPYVLHLEDDFLISCTDGELEKWLAKAVQILEDNPFLVQVRIARYRNEIERINNLKKKHNIDGKALGLNDDYFVHNDWSNNPYVARTRDLNAAIRLVFNSSLPKHSEHGMKPAMQFLSSAPLVFSCLNPEKIHCCHVGTKLGEEDSLVEPLIAN